MINREKKREIDNPLLSHLVLFDRQRQKQTGRDIKRQRRTKREKATIETKGEREEMRDKYSERKKWSDALLIIFVNKCFLHLILGKRVTKTTKKPVVT